MTVMPTTQHQLQAQAQVQQALVLHQQGKAAEALALYRRALQLDSRCFDALHFLAVLLYQDGQLSRAQEFFERALAERSDDAQALNNYGAVLRELGQPQAALENFERAAARQPDLAISHNNRGMALRDLGRYAEAIACFELAIQLEPHFAGAYRNVALCYLHLGQFARGWQAYEWRWKTGEKLYDMHGISQPRWSAKTQAQAHVLLWAEQGLGDQILCLGMLGELIGRVRQVTVALEPRLQPLVQRSFPHIQICALTDAAQQPCDAQLPMLSLGPLLRNSWDDFAQARHPYLVADMKRSAALHAQLCKDSPGQSRVCGLSWRSKNAQCGAAKSMQLVDLLPIFQLPGWQAVDLQYGDTSAERQALQAQTGFKLEHLAEVDNLGDIDALAALIAACDVIVTVSNTTAHIAAALGKPVYLMLPQATGLLWYWHTGRTDSPWYPSVRIFRQQNSGCWLEPVAQVAAQLMS